MLGIVFVAAAMGCREPEALAAATAANGPADGALEDAAPAPETPGPDAEEANGDSAPATEDREPDTPSLDGLIRKIPTGVRRGVGACSASGQLIHVKTGAPLGGLEIMLSPSAPGGRGPTRFVSTDGEGRFRVEDLPEGEYRLNVLSDAWAFADAPAVIVLTEGAALAVPALRVARNVSIGGRVFDADTREGIRGVVVEAAGEDTVRRSAPTGSAGFYKIEGLSEGAYTVTRGEASGYPPPRDDETCAVDVCLDAPRTGIDFAISKNLALRGRVIDDKGDPVENARVRCFLDGGDVRVAMSDAHGEFEFVVPSVERIRFVAVKGELTSALSEPATASRLAIEGVVLALTRGGSLSGRVVDGAGRPLSEMAVILRPHVIASMDAAMGRTAIVTNDGRFAVRGLCPATYGVVVKPQDVAPFPGRPDFFAGPRFSEAALGSDGGVLHAAELPFETLERELARIDVAAGQDVTDVVLVYDRQSNLSITGFVSDVSADPVANASVKARPVDGGIDATAYGSTKRDGSYEVVGLVEGLYEITVSAPDFAEVQLAGVPGGAKDVDVVLERLAAIEGRVIRADSGEPVTDFELRYEVERESPFGMGGIWSFSEVLEKMVETPPMLTTKEHMPVQDPQGRFSLPALEPGRVTIKVRAEGFIICTAVTPKLRGGDTLDGVEVRMLPAQPFEGVVVDESGAAIAGVAVSTRSPDDLYAEKMGLTKPPVVVTGADGGFRLAEIPAERFTLVADHPNYAKTFLEIVCGPAQNGPVRVVMPEGGSVRGAVTVNERPAESALVMLGADHEPQEAATRATTGDNDGVYVIDGVVPGPIHMAALVPPTQERPNVHLMMLDAQVEAGETAVVDFPFPAGSSVLEGAVTVEDEPAPVGIVSVAFQDAATHALVQRGCPILWYGYYRIEGIPAGAVTVIVECPMGEGKLGRRELPMNIERDMTLRCDFDMNNDDITDHEPDTKGFISLMPGSFRE